MLVTKEQLSAYGMTWQSQTHSLATEQSSIVSAHIHLTQDDLFPIASDLNDSLRDIPSHFGKLQTSAHVVHHVFEPSTTEQVAHLSLTGPMLATLMYRRQRHILHACSVVKPDGSVALVCGQSTAGKSTLTASLAKHGLAVLADDINAICYHQHQAIAYAGLGRIKLWDDALAKLALPTSGRVIRRIQAKSGTNLSERNPSETSGKPLCRDKYVVAHASTIAQAPVTEIIELRVDDVPEVSMADVRGSNKLSIIAANAYRPYMLAPLQVLDQQMRYALQLAKQVRLRRLIRPKHGNTINMITDLLLNEWARSSQNSA